MRSQLITALCVAASWSTYAYAQDASAFEDMTLTCNFAGKAVYPTGSQTIAPHGMTLEFKRYLHEGEFWIGFRVLDFSVRGGSGGSPTGVLSLASVFSTQCRGDPCFARLTENELYLSEPGRTKGATAIVSINRYSGAYKATSGGRDVGFVTSETGSCSKVEASRLF